MRNGDSAAMKDRRDKVLRRSQALAYFLDNSIGLPGTKFRIGWDVVIGLIPGFGDLLTGILAIYIVAQGVELGASRATVFRMVWNVIIDTVLGSVPLVGDLFDAGWKANVRNARLLEAVVKKGPARKTKDRLFMGMVALILFLVALAAGIFGLAVLKVLRDWIVSIS